MLASPASAATGINKSLNYQGRLLTAAGSIAPDGFYNMEFKIYQDGTGCVSGGTSPCGGTLKYTEDWVYGTGSPDNRVKVTNGYFSVQLGSVTPFSGIDWNQSVLWISVNIGNTSAAATFGAASGDGEMIPFKRLTAAPYALNADLLDGFDSTAFGDATAANQTTILNRIGTNADVAGTTTLFARLASIDTAKLGGNTDAASATTSSTLSAKLNYLTNAFSAVGATGDVTDSATGNIFQRLHDLFTRVSSIATNLNSLITTVGTTADTGGTTTTGTAMGKLNALLGAGGSGGGKALHSRTLTSGTSWAVPSGVTQVDVLVVGGGAGGGGGEYYSAGNIYYYGGGGGGSGVATKCNDQAVSGTVTYAIGAGGAGGYSGYNYGGGGGGSGGSSSFGACSSSGGSGGAGGGNGSTGGAGGSGGGGGGSYGAANGANNPLASGGAGGSAGSGGGSGATSGGASYASITSAAAAPQPGGGGGGGTPSGVGGNYGGGGGGNSGPGTAGNSGGGGGGGDSNSTGGSGGSGYVLVTWWQ